MVQNNRCLRIIVDSDTYTASDTKHKFRRDALDNAGIEHTHVFAVGDAEIEDLFDDQTWADTANRCWPRRDGREWTTADFRQLRSNGKFSRAITKVVEQESDSAPETKPNYLQSMADGITKEKIPLALGEIFDELLTINA